MVEEEGCALGAGVGHLDAQGTGRPGEAEMEVPALDMAVPNGVGGQLGGDQCQGASLAWEEWGWPQLSSRCETRRRARRAPLGEEVKRIENSRTTGVGEVWPFMR